MKWSQHVRATLAGAALLALGQAAAAPSHWQWSNPLPTGNFVTGLTWGGGMFVGVDDAGMVETSARRDFMDVALFGLRDYTPEDIAWDGINIVVVGWNGEILTSPDADTWTAQDSGYDRSDLGRDLERHRSSSRSAAISAMDSF